MKAIFKHEINESGLIYLYYNEKQENISRNITEILKSWGYVFIHEDKYEMKMLINENPYITIKQMREDYSIAKKSAIEMDKAGVLIGITHNVNL